VAPSVWAGGRGGLGACGTMSDVPVASALVPGDPTEIDGYRVDGRLGEGGQGVVFLATGPGGDRVAIKRLRPGVADDGSARQRLAKEVAAARQVAPFCTARVIDARLDGDHPHVVTEYIEGPSLQRRVQDGGPIAGAELFRLAVGTATALAAIHQAGVVHRDFKPANVMLADDGPRVIDFGIARDLTQETTVTSRVFGTPAYMAPEQVSGERATPATDVFAWGSTMVYAATGEAPFDAPHMVAVVHRITSADADLSKVPPALADVVRRCFEKDPAERPTAQEVVQLLLGRPQPAPDLTDPTAVLAEGTRVAESHTAQPPAAPVAAAGAAGVTMPRRPEHSQPLEGAWWMPAEPAQRTPLPAAGGTRPAPPAAPLPPAPARPRRSGPFIVVMLLAVLLAGGVATALLINGWNDRDGRATTGGPTTGPTPGPTTPDTATPEPSESTATETTTSAPPTPTPDAGTPVVPGGFDGRWKGAARQPGGAVDAWELRLDLRKGESTGEFRIQGDELDCRGTVTVLRAESRALVLDTPVSEADGPCAERGTATLARRGKTALFTWEDAANPSNRAAGVLTLED
jgi:predicted Ser/Thr protein kinase